MGDVVELLVPARAEYLALVRLVVSAAVAIDAGLSESRIGDLKLAVSEACTNAMEAANRADDAEQVLVRCSIDDERVEVLVRDRGMGFDPASLRPHPPVTDPARLDFERGLGIPLIRALTDEVTFESSEKGTDVCLVLYLGEPPEGLG
ncbi:MAG TPA: ATP-binding protein [Acidimicrobiales bacterium]